MPAHAHPVAAFHLAYFSVAFCQPLQLLINFALFQYLFTVYFARRRQPRVVLLLLTAAVGFLTLMPFAIADKQCVASLHAISEVCCYLTFLQQITILTRDVNRKLKLRSLVWFMWCAELLIVASIIIVGLNGLEIGDPGLHLHFSEHADSIIETVSLWFIVVFRFYFLAMVRGGWRALWRSPPLRAALLPALHDARISVPAAQVLYRPRLEQRQGRLQQADDRALSVAVNQGPLLGRSQADEHLIVQACGDCGSWRAQWVLAD
ncbi:hypothetical protein PINS_up023710 [Pythium insidiosum]|nr:hypothetical protein PINS_up023710 [Pythium insidiosum]